MVIGIEEVKQRWKDKQKGGGSEYLTRIKTQLEKIELCKIRA